MGEKLTFIVTGEDKLHCESCEARVGKALKRLPGVKTVKASQQTQKVEVSFDPKGTSKEAIEGRLQELGYEVSPAQGS